MKYSEASEPSKSRQLEQRRIMSAEGAYSQQFRSTGVLDARTSFSPSQTHRRPRVTTRSATPPPPTVRAPLKFS